MSLISTFEILQQYLEDIQSDFLSAYRNDGFEASGNTERELEVELQGFKGVLKGPDYLFAMVTGRGPGGFPPLEFIEDWIVAKGITPDGDISLQSLAFLIARKIARQGTDVFEGKREGIDIEGIVSKRTQEVTKIIARQIKLNAVAEVSRIVNQAL